MSQDTHKTSAKHRMQQLYAGNIPDSVEIIYFYEGPLNKIGSRVVIVAIEQNTDTSSFNMGYAIFRRDHQGEKFDKKALRTTACMRLQHKTITVCGPSNLEQKLGESDEAYHRRCALRRQEWESCFGTIGAEHIKNWPSKVWRGDDESDEHYKTRVNKANRDNNWNNELREQKEILIQRRRAFIRHAIHANPVPKNEVAMISSRALSSANDFTSMFLANMIMGDSNRTASNPLCSQRSAFQVPSRERSRSFTHKM